MDAGIKITIVWWDDDLVELEIIASNGRFAGRCRFYEQHDVFAKLAESMKDFPCLADDARKLALGNFDPACGGGGFRFEMACRDRAGHADMRVFVRADGDDTFGKPETAFFSIPVEAAGIDSFVSALEHMELKQGATVRLRTAT